MKSDAISSEIITPRNRAFSVQAVGIFTAFLFCLSCGGGSGTSGGNPLASANTVTGAGIGTGPTLGVHTGDGVRGTPASTANYANGSIVSYSFSPLDGASDLFVTLDGVTTNQSGTVAMNKDHSLIAYVNNLPGAHAPEFSGQTVDGTLIHLSGYRGRVVLFNFAEVSCVGAQDEAPALQTYYDAYHARGLEVVSVLSLSSTASTATIDDLRAWTGTYRPTYPVISDPGSAYKVYDRDFVCGSEDCSSFPTTYIVNESGVILYRLSGFSGPDISAALAALYP